MKNQNRIVALACALLALSLSSLAAQPPAAGAQTPLPSDPLRRAYFGDLHLHTANSLDAAWAGVRTTPREAYRYAQGEEILYMGHPVRRRVPLDFLAIADHAEYMGVSMAILEKAPEFEESNWYASLTEGARPGFTRLMGSAFRGTESLPELNSEALKTRNWREVIRVAEAFNQPGRFTTFVAFEWSDMPNGGHNHRVAVFRGPSYPAMPFSALDSRQPADLWRYADAHRAQGIDLALIPHNPNLSNGQQLTLLGPDGGPMSREYAEAKARNEWLIEVTQVKGTSETHPLLSPSDRFAAFEIMEHYVNGQKAPPDGSYVRQGLARGLQIAESTGVNPYPFGFVGSTDFHSGTSATEEDNFTGALGDSDFPFDGNAKKVLTEPNPVTRQPQTGISAGGLTGVWAEQNTREAIFAALRRREVFATTGPRMQVRMFAGFGLPQGLIRQPDWIARAYAQGVPMGGTLEAAPGSTAPRILVQAQKEPDGANLDRIQIVKVWRAAGQNHEKVFDVAVSGDSSNGRPELATEWVDPEFDARVPAVYYARVLEIPTPRWTTYLALRNGLPLPTTAPATLQERAFTSPVFYLP
jgi:hypothetical protein